MKQDNDAKYSSKSIIEWLKQEKSRSVSMAQPKITDLKPIEMLWHNRKRAVHKRLSTNVSKLKRCCKEEWAKIPP